MTIVSKTYNSAGHDKGPETGRGIGPDGLQHRHLMFDLLGLDGACAVIVDLLVGIVDGAAVGGRLRLDLCHGGRLLCLDVAHVGDVSVGDDEQTERERKKTVGTDAAEAGAAGVLKSFAARYDDPPPKSLLQSTPQSEKLMDHPGPCPPQTSAHPVCV